MTLNDPKFVMWPKRWNLTQWVFYFHQITYFILFRLIVLWVIKNSKFSIFVKMTLIDPRWNLKPSLILLYQISYFLMFLWLMLLWVIEKEFLSRNSIFDLKDPVTIFCDEIHFARKLIDRLNDWKWVFGISVLTRGFAKFDFTCQKSSLSEDF